MLTRLKIRPTSLMKGQASLFHVVNQLDESLRTASGGGTAQPQKTRGLPVSRSLRRASGGRAASISLDSSGSALALLRSFAPVLLFPSAPVLLRSSAPPRPVLTRSPDAAPRVGRMPPRC